MVSLALFVSALGAAEPLLTKHIFDTLAGRGSFQVLALTLGGLVVLEVARAACSGWMSVLMWNIRLRTDFRLREQLIGKLYSLPIGYHREQRVGGTINKLNQSIQSFLNTFIEIAASSLPALVFLVLSLIAMFRLDWRLTLAVLAFLPAPTLIGAWAAREQAHRERLLMEQWSRIYARLSETLTGILTVQGFARERGEVDQFLSGTEAGNTIVRHGVQRDTLTTGARHFAATLARLVAIGFGGYLAMRGEITVGTLVAFLGYIGGLFGPVQGLTGSYQTLRRGMVALEYIFGLLDTRDDLRDLPEAPEAAPLAGAVSFRDVHFTYPSGTPALRQVDLEVCPGETVALVGPSGSGKTTLAALLQRQYDVTAGSILVDGTDLRGLSLTSLRRQIGVVFQEVHLFNDTIHANIAYGRPEATRAAVEAAARAAHAHDFIMALPEGYETVLGEQGNRLSGGQKQRLAIARALLIDPPILVLDEATSALDAESEAVLQAALRNLMRGRTTFVIAHRLSTVKEADRIVVLRNGQVDAVGTHPALMAEGGYYAYLVNLQSNGFLFSPETGPGHGPMAMAA